MSVAIDDLVFRGGRFAASTACTLGGRIWRCVSEGKYGREMGNVANINCPVCRGVDITKAWLIGNGYYECNSCGARFKL